MTCTNMLDNGQLCGDEGELCESCLIEEWEEWAYLKGLPRYAVIDDEQSREELNQELRDAGRGHLCR